MASTPSKINNKNVRRANIEQKVKDAQVCLPKINYRNDRLTTASHSLTMTLAKTGVHLLNFFSTIDYFNKLKCKRQQSCWIDRTTIDSVAWSQYKLDKAEMRVPASSIVFFVKSSQIDVLLQKRLHSSHFNTKFVYNNTICLLDNNSSQHLRKTVM